MPTMHSSVRSLARASSSSQSCSFSKSRYAIRITRNASEAKVSMMQVWINSCKMTRYLRTVIKILAKSNRASQGQDLQPIIQSLRRAKRQQNLRRSLDVHPILAIQSNDRRHSLLRRREGMDLQKITMREPDQLYSRSESHLDSTRLRMLAAVLAIRLGRDLIRKLQARTLRL